MKLPLLVLAAALVLAGCAVTDTPVPPSAPAQSDPLAPMADPGERLGTRSYWVMAGEMALHRGDYAFALEAWSEAVAITTRAEVAERAAEVALALGDDEVALLATERWLELAPEREDAARVLMVLYLRAGREEEALAHARGLLEREGHSTRETLIEFKALLAEEVRDDDAALRLARALGEDYDGLPEYHYLLGSVAYSAGHAGEAADAAGRARSMAPGWVQPHVLHARALVRLDREDEGLEVIRGVVMEHPGDDWLRLAYGQMLFDTGQPEYAERELERLLEANPELPEAIYALGLLAQEQRRFEDAYDYFIRLLRTGERPDNAYYHLGVLEQKQGNHDTALRWLSQVQQGQYVLPAQIRLADSLAATGSLSTARELLGELRKRNPSVAVSLYEAEGVLLYRQGRYPEALELYDKALREHRDEYSLLYGRALVNERLDRLRAAERDLRRILEQRPDDTMALNALGYTLADRTRRHDEALDYIQRAFEQEPDNPAVIDSMGWVKYRLGDYEAAERYLRRAHAMSEDPEIAAHLGEVLWVTGREDEAQAIWRQALEVFPDSDILHETVERFKR